MGIDNIGEPHRLFSLVGQIDSNTRNDALSILHPYFIYTSSILHV